jgi:hypothetical protein
VARSSIRVTLALLELRWRRVGARSRPAAAVRWAGERLLDTEVLVQGLAGVPLNAIRADDEIGRRIAGAASEVLGDTGETVVTVDRVQQARGQFNARDLAAWQAAAP